MHFQCKNVYLRGDSQYLCKRLFGVPASVLSMLLGFPNILRISDNIFWY